MAVHLGRESTIRKTLAGPTFVVCLRTQGDFGGERRLCYGETFADGQHGEAETHIDFWIRGNAFEFTC